MIILIWNCGREVKGDQYFFTVCSKRSWPLSWSLSLRLQSSSGRQTACLQGLWVQCYSNLRDLIPFLHFACEVNHSKKPRNPSPCSLLWDSKKTRMLWVQVRGAAWSKEERVFVQHHDLCLPPALLEKAVVPCCACILPEKSPTGQNVGQVSLMREEGGREFRLGPDSGLGRPPLQLKTNK